MARHHPPSPPCSPHLPACSLPYPQLPITAEFPPTVRGATSEAFADRLAKFCATNPGGVLAVTGSDKEGGPSGKKKGSGKGKEGAALKGPAGAVDAATFSQLMQLKFMRTLAAAGEAVGVLAAQSVGERPGGWWLVAAATAVQLRYWLGWHPTG